MAINDRYQLLNYGSEVQQAIDNALIHLPAELALKAYKDEVLLKTQTVAYTPTAPYHPATKQYVDNTGDAINSRLDAEITRATNAENVLNTKRVLTSSNNTYKYVNLSTLTTSQALIDENALEAKLGELSLGFFVFYQVKPDGTLVEESKDNTGTNPYIIVNTQAQLPTSGVTANALALTLNNMTTINVYKWSGSAWSLLKSPTVNNGWLFSSSSNNKGYYWFQNSWNLIDMNVDMSQYYKKTEIDNILTGYVQNTTLGTISDLNTTIKTTIVAAINEVNTTAKAKDTLPSIPAYSVLANTTGNAGKPNNSYTATTAATGATLAFRTSSGTLRAADATANNDLTTLSQVNSLIAGADHSAYQTKIKAGTANNIVAYSGTAGTLNELTRSTSIATSPTDTQIPTAKATKTYVDAYKPTIITQGSSSTSVTTSQLTFWIEA